MPSTSTNTKGVLPWVDRALTAAGHPTTATIVRRGRSAKPRRTSWDDLAADISAKAGGAVSGETLRLAYSHLDPTEAA